MRSKLAPDQSFWRDLATRFDEKEAARQLEEAIDKQERAIALAGRILAIRHAPGFSDFCQALRDLQEHATYQLSTTTASNEQMRVLQGQVQAYSNILAVVDKGEQQVQALEKAREGLQNDLATIKRPTTETKP